MLLLSQLSHGLHDPAPTQRSIWLLNSMGDDNNGTDDSAERVTAIEGEYHYISVEECTMETISFCVIRDIFLA